jgi:hypothetical protein
MWNCSSSRTANEEPFYRASLYERILAGRAWVLIRLFNRIRAAMASAGPSVAIPSETASNEEPGSIRYVLADAVEDAKPRSLISALGDPPSNLGEVLESVAFACRAKGEFPVVVVSELRPGLIAASTVPIEFMPTRQYLPVRPDEYERHVRRRWSLMIAKWEFAKQIELSLGFEAFLAEQMQGVPAEPAAQKQPLGYALAREA